MPRPRSNPKAAAITPPPECTLLHDRQKRSGLTVADLAAATGLSVSTINNSLRGYRYRKGDPIVVVPPDTTLAELASQLLINPESLRRVGRPEAADLLAANKPESVHVPVELPELEDEKTLVATQVRRSLVRRVLEAFTDQELRDELERRAEAVPDRGRDRATATDYVARTAAEHVEDLIADATTGEKPCHEPPSSTTGNT